FFFSLVICLFLYPFVIVRIAVFTLFPYTTLFRSKVFRLFELKPAKLMHFSSTQPIKESVGAGLGISLLSRWAIQKELRNGDLKTDRKSTRLNSSHVSISYAFFCLQKKTTIK